MPKVIRTICCKLDLLPEQADALAATAEAFAKACNYVLAVKAKSGEVSQFGLHKLCYEQVRQRFGLSANLAVRAIARVAAAKKGKAFNRASVDYDARLFSFREKDWSFSLNTVAGRIRLKAVVGEFQKMHLAGQKPTSAQLVCRKGCFYLNVQVKAEVKPAAAVGEFLGVDLGLARIATDSTGEFFSGEQVEQLRQRRSISRKQYQRAGTKSAKRRLRKMAGRQARFQKQVNHVISKRLVAKAKALSAGIALENLSGLRGRTEKTASRKLRSRIGNWSFHQLRAFIEYKACAEGVPVVLVNPAYSSQTCSACGHCERANRRNQSEFACLHCGLSMNADWNAALNIKAWADRKPAPKVSTCKGQGQSPRL